MSDANIVKELLINYFTEEKMTAIGLVLLSLVVNGIQAQGISRITAELVQSIENANRKRTTQVIFYLCIAFLIFVVLNNMYKRLQTYFLTKLKQWMRVNMLNVLLISNKEEMEELNYPQVASPINRSASSTFNLFSTILNSILPSVSFIIIISAFLLFTRPELGIMFITGNVIAWILIWSLWETISSKFQSAIEVEYENELHLLEVLHNFDKIIYRGQSQSESNIFKDKTTRAFERAFDFQSTLATYSLIINALLSSMVLFIIWFASRAFYAKEITVTYFITVLTMMILYRDKNSSMIDVASEFAESIGRANSILKHFKDVTLDKVERKYEPVNLPFNKIVFDNISFKYKTNTVDAVSGLSVAFDTSKHDIIGITGLSGKGKSTIMKILLKMHSAKEGTVYIDGHNIDELSPDYIRANITYVSQNGKLFDRVVLDNMMYGCSHPETCSAELKRVLKYPKIRDLFKNIDMENKRSGNLGESLSGGQRQVVNIIGGLINPSKILILDEPTNALDPALKWELMQVIQDYSEKKNAILIITHDKEMNQIFTSTVKL
jgi:ABC-type bacteriocin/lantibiotic exporter with double-glycine peptidase domain